MSVQLYPHQADVIRGTRDALREANSALVVAPTGMGKTVLSSFMAGSAASRGRRVTFGCHRKELIKQTAKTFDLVGIDYGIIAAGFPGNRHAPVQIASIPTLAARLDRYAAPDLYLVDEAHHAGAKTWAGIIDHYKAGGSKVVGLSATPERLDGTGLAKWFDRMVSGPSTAWLIDNGYLSSYRMFAAAEIPDLKGIKKVGGDLNKGEVEAKVSTVRVVGNAVKHYAQLAHGKRAMAFCVSIKHSMLVVEQFQKAGYSAAHIDGDMDPGIRDRLIAAFEAGRIQILSSVDLVSEGFDLPALEVAILLRPTDSLGLYIQQVGRALRAMYAEGFDRSTSAGRLAAIAAGPKPEALILDHAGNSIPRERGGRGHGLPDDERQWTLLGREKRKRGASNDEEEVVDTRQCPTCYRMHPPAPTCPQCGHVYPVQGRTVKELEGELLEVERRAQAERKVEQAKAQTVEDLIKVGKARGMKNPHGWARHVAAAREKKAQERYVR